MKRFLLVFILLLSACDDYEENYVFVELTTIRVCARGSGPYRATFSMLGNDFSAEGELPNERNVRGSGLLEVTYSAESGDVCLWFRGTVCTLNPPPDAECGERVTIRIRL